MEKIIIAVGSTRRPKINAAREALDIFHLGADVMRKFEIVGIEVPSGVSHTPLSRDELMAGARQRAEALMRMAREKGEPWKYFAGLEGGLDVVHEGGRRWVFLESWAYVADTSGHGAFGQSGSILVPEALAKRVVDEGVELADAIDAFAGGRGLRDAQGAWGVLTRNLVTRQDSFRAALINAFSPFFNCEIYSARSEKARA